MDDGGHACFARGRANGISGLPTWLVSSFLCHRGRRVESVPSAGVDGIKYLAPGLLCCIPDPFADFIWSVLILV